MTPFKLSEATIGQRVVVIEPIEDETRWKHYERREGVAQQTFSKAAYLCVYSLRAVQGQPGKKPRWDSGEGRTESEMPAVTMVVDAKYVSHDWTEAHDGLMIVGNGGWIGFYLNQKLFHVLASNERPYHQAEEAVIRKTIETVGDIAVGRAMATWTEGPLFHDDLSKMKLRMD